MLVMNLSLKKIFPSWFYIRNFFKYNYLGEEYFIGRKREVPSSSHFSAYIMRNENEFTVNFL